MALTQPIKILLVGATGETGKSILDGLLEAKQFKITALVRQASAEKPSVLALKDRGVGIQIGSASDDVPSLVNILSGFEIVISAIGPQGQLTQFNLADAAKQVNVKRFIPCAFTTVCPPGGVMLIRDEKEEIYQHMRKLYLPYTVIDVGYCTFWQARRPPVLPMNVIYGDGNQETILTDLRDVGKFVAKIILDERTLNQFVVTQGESLSQNEICEKVEKLFDEKIDRKFVTAEDLANSIVAAKAAAKEDPKNIRPVYSSQYSYSKFIRGDNSPEHAKYLGYLNTMDLYPDFKLVTFDEFLLELKDGKVPKPYADRLNG